MKMISRDKAAKAYFATELVTKKDGMFYDAILRVMLLPSFQSANQRIGVTAAIEFRCNELIVENSLV